MSNKVFKTFGDIKKLVRVLQEFFRGLWYLSNSIGIWHFLENFKRLARAAAI